MRRLDHHTSPSYADHQTSFVSSPMCTMCSLSPKTANAGGDWLRCALIFWSPTLPSLSFHEVPSKMDHQISCDESSMCTMCNASRYTASEGVPSLSMAPICSSPSTPWLFFHVVPSNIDQKMSFPELPRCTRYRTLLNSTSAGTVRVF